jgi:hypothetical protein
MRLQEKDFENVGFKHKVTWFSDDYECVRMYCSNCKKYRLFRLVRSFLQLIHGENRWNGIYECKECGK